MSDSYFSDCDIKEIPLGEVEVNRIQKLIIGKVKGGQKRKVRRAAAILIASCIVLMSITAFAFSDINFVEMLRGLFGDRAAHIENSIYPINKSVSQNGLTLTVQGVAGYEKNALILFDVTRDDGRPFVGDNVRAGSIDVKTDCPDRSLSISSGRMIDNKWTYAAYIRSAEELENKKATLTFGNLRYRELRFEKASINLSQYSRAEQGSELKLVENMSPYMVHRQTYTPHLIGFQTIQDEVVREPSQLQKEVLAPQSLGAVLLDSSPDVTMDSIGFVDGKLHMRIISQRPKEYVSLYMIERETGKVVPEDVWHESYDEGVTYFIFDIPDNADIEKYDLMMEHYGEEQIYKGTWTIDFQLNYDYVVQDTKPSIDLRDYEEDYKLEVFDATPISTTIRLKLKEGRKMKPGAMVAADIRMKDGSSVQPIGTSGSTNNVDFFEYTANYYPLDVNDIDSVIIRDYEEYMKEMTQKLIDEIITKSDK